MRMRVQPLALQTVEPDFGDPMTELADPFRIIAHRGASGYAPENTMAAFQRAVDMGATEVETDVCFTRDRRLLLLHDDSLDRTTNGSGLPEDYTLDELKLLDAGSWVDERLSWDRAYGGEKLITLQELLDRFGDSLTYHVEIKKPMQGLVPAVIDAIRERGLIDQAFIAAIDDDRSLQEAMRLAPGIRVASAPVSRIRQLGPGAIEECARHGYAMVTLASFNQSTELVDLAHSLGMEARSSGIAHREQMIEAAEMGCNGMTINWPDWLIDYVRDRTG
jgi:glycerophosphoryl diester phosphodiesterase